MPRTATEASFATGAAPRTPHARAQLLPASPACRHIELVDGAAILRRGRGTLRPTAQPPSRAGAPPPPPRPSAFRSPPSALPSALPYSTSAHTTGRRPAPLSRAPLSPRSLLDTHWRADLTEEQGLELLERCFKEVQTRFMISMPNFTIKVVDKNGVRTVERKS